MITVKKNFCTTCKRNFAVEGMFFTHRVGKYPSENHGVSTRRCLTDSEMYAKGWLLQQLMVKVYVDGSPTTVPMDTWITPDYLRKMEALATKDMSTVRRGRKNVPEGADYQ